MSARPKTNCCGCAEIVVTLLDAAELLGRRGRPKPGLRDYGDPTLPERFAVAVDHLNGLGMDADGDRRGGAGMPMAADLAAGIHRRPQPLPDRRRGDRGADVRHRRTAFGHNADARADVGRSRTRGRCGSGK